MKKIFLTHKNDETRVAVFEDDEFADFYVSKFAEPNLKGNIYKGIVKKNLPGMNSAFVDIGRDKNVFLRLNSGQKVSPGQSVLLQIDKNSTDFKSPRATLNVDLPGRNLVLMPTSNYIGVSRKVLPEEKIKLYEIAKKIRPPKTGILMRTAAADCPEEILISEVEYLQKLWAKINERFSKRKPPALLYDDNDFVAKIIREEFSKDTEIFLIDNVKIFNHAVEIANEFYPELSEKISHYEGILPMFEEFEIEKEIAKLSEREVPLPSGGVIVIDKTEALTVIDVNSGKFFGETDKEKTVYETNTEAAEIILKQIRLRDPGGIIIVDFIDMIDEEQKESLLELLRETARRDKSRTKIVDITPLGLVEITRKKRDL